MTITFDRMAARRTARTVFAGVAMLAAVQGAAASDDAGVREFFSGMFGGAVEQPAAAPAPVQRYVVRPAYHVRPHSVPMDHARTHTWAASYAGRSWPARNHALTVRLHRAKPANMVAQMPTKPRIVSIFQDRTLRRGDAVMMANGIRIFAGSSSWPYKNDDFVSLSAARDLSKSTTKVLAEMDRLPRG